MALPAKIAPLAVPAVSQKTRRVPSGGAYERLLAGVSKGTAAEYERDFRAFAKFMGSSSAQEALADLLSRDGPTANALALEWRDEGKAAGLASATVNRRLASLRSFLKIARLFGLCNWTFEVDQLRHEAKMDPTGPGADTVLAIDELLITRSSMGDDIATRDLALVRIYSTCLLRRMEPLAIDYPSEVDLGPEPRIRFRGKGKREKSWFPLGQMTAEAIRDWIKIRGTNEGPLFVTLGRNSSGKRLTVGTVHAMFIRLSKQVGKRVRAHGLRHTGATEALEMTNGNFRDVSRLTRHSSTAMLQRYDDARTSSPRKLVDGLEGVLLRRSR